MRFEINETATGIVTPDKDVCKVRGCEQRRLKKKRAHAFCKEHSGLRRQMAKRKFKELMGNNELVVV